MDIASVFLVQVIGGVVAAVATTAAVKVTLSNLTKTVDRHAQKFDTLPAAYVPRGEFEATQRAIESGNRQTQYLLQAILAREFDHRIDLKGVEASADPRHNPKGVSAMNLFVNLLGYGLALLPTIALGVQKGVGDSQSGKSKAQIALDELAIAMQGAASVLVPGSANATLATEAGAVAGIAINVGQSVADVIEHLKSTDAVTTAVNLNKATGVHQTATASYLKANSTLTQTANQQGGRGQDLSKL